MAFECKWLALTKSLALSRWHSSARPDRTLQLTATDPFTAAAYQSRLGNAAQTWSFEEIAEGLWDREGVAPWDVVICSYALHLLSAQPLHATLLAIAKHSRLLLVVMTPPPRPRIVCRPFAVSCIRERRYRLPGAFWSLDSCKSPMWAPHVSPLGTSSELCQGTSRAGRTVRTSHFTHPAYPIR